MKKDNDISKDSLDNKVIPNEEEKVIIEEVDNDNDIIIEDDKGDGILIEGENTSIIEETKDEINTHIEENVDSNIRYSSQLEEEKIEKEDEDGGLFSSLFSRKKKVFDDDKDKQLAQEMTKSVPPAVIEKEDVTYEAPYTEKVEYEDVDYVETNKNKEDVNKEITKEEVDDRSLNERRGSKLKRRMTLSTLLLIISGILFWLAPDIQKSVFQTKDNSLVFSSARGFFGPRMGILEIVLGIFGIAMLFNALVTRFKEKRTNRNVVPTTVNTILKRLGLILMLLIPIGITNLFNYTEFRTNDIRFANFLNQNDIRDYSQVTSQKAFLEGKDIIYEIQSNSKKADFAINKEAMDTVKILDKKMNPNRNVFIDNLTFQEIVKSGLYTEKEAFEIFKFNLKKN